MTFNLVADVVAQQNTTNHTLIVVLLLWLEYARNGPAISTWDMKNAGAIVKLLRETGPIDMSNVRFAKYHRQR